MERRDAQYRDRLQLHRSTVYVEARPETTVLSTPCKKVLPCKRVDARPVLYFHFHACTFAEKVLCGKVRKTCTALFFAKYFCTALNPELHLRLFDRILA